LDPWPQDGVFDAERVTNCRDQLIGRCDPSPQLIGKQSRQLVSENSELRLVGQAIVLFPIARIDPHGASAKLCGAGGSDAGGARSDAAFPSGLPRPILYGEFSD
jgi:hypothetical protein